MWSGSATCCWNTTVWTSTSETAGIPCPCTTVASPVRSPPPHEEKDQNSFKDNAWVLITLTLLQSIGFQGSVHC